MVSANNKLWIQNSLKLNKITAIRFLIVVKKRKEMKVIKKYSMVNFMGLIVVKKFWRAKMIWFIMKKLINNYYPKFKGVSLIKR